MKILLTTLCFILLMGVIISLSITPVVHIKHMADEFQETEKEHIQFINEIILKGEFYNE